ncbi:MAG: PAS domain-containing protein [Lachnospiraceae bacterium]
MNNNYSDLLGETISSNIMIRYMEIGLSYQYIGQKMLDFLGYNSEEECYQTLDGKLTNLIHPDDIQFVMERVNQQLTDFGEYTIEYRICKKDGSYVWIQDRGKSIEAPDGKMLVLFTYYDLSKQNVMGVSDEARLYADIVNQSTHGIYVIEQESLKLLYVNHAMEEMFANAGIHNYLGEKCFCALRHRNEPCKECFAYPIINADEPREVYLDFLSAYYSVVSHAIEWRGIPACVIYLSDISEGKYTRLELAKTKKKLIAAIDHAGLAYWEYDIINNRAFLNSISTTEYVLDEVIDNYPARLYETGAIHPDSISMYEFLIQEVRKGKPTAKADIKTIDAQGKLLWKRVKFTTMFDEDNKPFWAIATAESINDYKELENRFATVLEQNHIDTWLYDFSRETIIQNHNTEDIYGIYGMEIPNAPESLIERKRCHPDDVELFLEFYRKLRQGEQQVSATVRLWDIRKQGYIWKRCTYTILPNRDEKPIYALGSAVDVTDQIEVKQKYENAIQYHYRTLGENVILAGHCNVTQNTILELEDRTGLDVKRRFGMNREEFFRGIGSLIPNKEQQDVFCNTFLNENIRNSFELGITKHDYECTIGLENNQNIRWIATHVDTALQPETNELIGFLTVTDITVSKMQEQVLDVVIQFDYDFVAHLNLYSNTTVFYNSKNQRSKFKDYKYGVPYIYSDAVQHTSECYITEEDQNFYTEKMKIKNVIMELENKDSYELTYHLRETNGEIRTKKTRFAMYDRTAGIVVFSRADVTDMLVQQEKQKIALSESLTIAQQANSSKSKFLASMSHDIRTPMNAIVGMCNLAISDEQNTKQVHESLQVIEQSSALLLSMITDILDMNRIESGKMVLTNETFSFSEQLKLALGRARGLASKKHQNVELIVDIIHDSCNGDIVRIHRVIDNILTNALKFTPEGGTITYRLTESILEHKHISLYRFEISDTGIGISPEQQPYIFEPFYRVQNSMVSQIEGTGLGLSIVKSVVDYMGGTITVHSKLNVGTTFIIELPLHFREGESEGLEGLKVAVDSFDISGMHVLLCEDHPMNQLVATRILEKNGVDVTLADNGQLGYHIFMQSKQGAFDAILMDIQMPVMNGYEATQAIRKCSHPQAETIPILAMTANAFSEDVQKSIKAGMNDHLAKPIEPKQLSDTLAKYYHQGVKQN